MGLKERTDTFDTKVPKFTIHGALRKLFIGILGSIFVFLAQHGYEFFTNSYLSLADMFPDPNLVSPLALTEYLSSQLQCNVSSDSCCITLGPVIGVTTAVDGRVMVESNQNGPLTVQLVSTSNNTDIHTLTTDTIRLTPTLFHFRGLRPAQTYTVHFPGCAYPYPSQPEGGYGLLKTKPASPDAPLALAVLSCNNVFEEAHLRSRREELLQGNVRAIHYRVRDDATVDTSPTIDDDAAESVATQSTSARAMSRLDTWAALAAEAHTLDGALHLGDQIYADNGSAGMRHHAFAVARRALVLYLREAYRQALAATAGVDMLALARGADGVSATAQRVACKAAEAAGDGDCAYDVSTVLLAEHMDDAAWTAAVDALYGFVGFPRQSLLQRLGGGAAHSCPLQLGADGAWSYSVRPHWLLQLLPALGGAAVRGHLYTAPLPVDTPAPAAVLSLVPCPHALTEAALFAPTASALTRLGPLVPASLRHAAATAYQHLYQMTWSRPATRLALSRVASAFLLDDHVRSS